VPNRARWLTESLAQDAYFLRYHKGRSVPEIAGLLQLHPRTVVRYIKRVEAQEVPWPPLRYRVFTQIPEGLPPIIVGLACPHCGKAVL